MTVQIKAGFDVAVKQLAGYTLIKIIGLPSHEQLLSLAHLMGVDSGGWASDCALVDLRDVATPFTPEQQFELGREVAASMAHMRKLASVVPPSRVTHVSERAAQREGTNLRVFDSFEAAQEWVTAQ
jgi:hypothetical protein